MKTSVLSINMRLCRTCLATENGVEFMRLFDSKEDYASALFDVSQIKVEDDKNLPALICPKCQIDLRSAANFRKISLIADQYFRNQSINIERQNFVKEELPEESIQQEIVDMEQFVLAEEEFVDQEVEIGEIEALDEYADEIIEYDIYEDRNIIFEEHLVENVAIKLESEGSVKRETENKRYTRQCHCGKKFPSKTRLDNHIKTQHTNMSEDEKLVCLTCGKRFKVQEYLEAHIRNQHTDNPMKHRQKVPCSKCGKVLKSITALRNHEDKHNFVNLPESEIKKLSCDLCGMRFRLKSYVFNHMQNVHLRNKYKCQICGLGFYKKYEQEEHIIRAHTKEKPILCEYAGCGKAFARQKNYVIHKRIHTGERPFGCDYCEKRFMHFIDKKRHTIKHTGNKPYPCKLCPKAYSRKTELDSHIRSHGHYS